jgi:hypothetical protein
MPRLPTQGVMAASIGAFAYRKLLCTNTLRNIRIAYILYTSAIRREGWTLYISINRSLMRKWVEDGNCV